MVLTITLVVTPCAALFAGFCILVCRPKVTVHQTDVGEQVYQPREIEQGEWADL